MGGPLKIDMAEELARLIGRTTPGPVPPGRPPEPDPGVPVGPRRRAWGRSGIKGVSQLANGRWQARVRWGGRLHSLGTHDTDALAGAAVAAFLAARAGEGEG